jgi:hypothetical protein
MKRRPVVGMVALAEHGQPAAVLPLEDALDADGVRSVRRWFGASSQERTVVGRFHSRTSRFPRASRRPSRCLDPGTRLGSVHVESQGEVRQGIQLMTARLLPAALCGAPKRPAPV